MTNKDESKTLKIKKQKKEKKNDADVSAVPAAQNDSALLAQTFVIVLLGCPASITDDLIRQQYKGMDIADIVRTKGKTTNEPTGNVIVIFNNEWDAYQAIQKGSFKGPDGKQIQSVKRKITADATTSLFLRDCKHFITPAVKERYAELGTCELSILKGSKKGNTTVSIRFETPDSCLKAFAMGPLKEDGEVFANVHLNADDLKRVVVLTYPVQVQKTLRYSQICHHYAPIGKNVVRKIDIHRPSHKIYVHFLTPESAQKAIAMEPPVVDGSSLQVKPFLEGNLAAKLQASEEKGAESKKQMNVVYLGGCPESITEEVIRKQYASLGKNAVTDVRFPRDLSGKLRSFGYVTFQTDELAAKAVGMGLFQCPDGKSIRRIDWAPSEHKPVQHGEFEAAEIHLSDCPESISEAVIRKQYASLGADAITSVRVPLYPNGIPKGFGYVDFKSAELAAKAVEMGPFKCPGGKFVKKVQFAAKKKDSLKRKASEGSENEVASKSQRTNGKSFAKQPSEPTKTNRIILLGCPRTLEDATVRKQYASLGHDAIVAIVWPTHPNTAQRRGICFVTFKTIALASKAVEMGPFSNPDGEAVKSVQFAPRL